MVATTIESHSETGAIFSYTPINEKYTRVGCKEDQEMWFGGRMQKMVSSLSAFATSRFYKQILDRMPEFAYYLRHSMQRVWNVTNQVDVFRCTIMETKDAIKNSISQVMCLFYS